MKKFLKMLLLLIVLLIIIALFACIIDYLKDCIKSILDINDFVKEIENKKENIEDKINIVETNSNIEKPEKNARFGTLKIPSIDVELAMMNGTSKNLLNQGVGFDDESYLPGEGGSIILMGHNFKQFLARLPEVQNGDEVIIETNYGEFNYTVYDSKIVKETDVSKVPIQNYEEIVMIYTCWPIPNVSHANDRYVIYAK